MKNKVLPIANFATLLVAIGINYFINAPQDHGTSISEISDKYANLLTPADYAFSIWGPIYLALLVFAIYQLRNLFLKNGNNDFVLKIGWWFVVANLANACWGIAFKNDHVGLSLLIMLVLFFSLLKIVLNLNMEKWNAPTSTIVFTWWPISIYFGWVSVALIANISSFLTALGWNGTPLNPTWWAIIILIVAGAIFVSMIWKRSLRECALAGIWGIVAISVKNWGSLQLVAYVGITVALVIFINVAIHAYKNRASLPFRK